MKKDTTARLIGEETAGMIAVEIWECGKLVWSHNYTMDGATYEQYDEICRQAGDDMINAKDWRDYDGGDMNEDGKPVLQNCCPETGVVVEYKPLTKSLITVAGYDMGMTGDVIIAGKKVSDMF
jgi:hypothetical protein